MAVVAFDSARLNGAVSRTRQYLAGFTPGQKTVSALAAPGLVIGGALFVTHASGPSYTVLYSNLQSSQAGQVTQKLTSDHVPYELQDGGATVLVPETDVNQERISLAEAGLPSGGTITFQTLASTGITSSQFVQNVDYQEALEGQLASTIESIQGIENAQVSLVMPDTSSFAIANTQTPTASVLVDLTDGTERSSDQVQGIVHLVASSVPSLDANNVTVVDNNGNVLSAPGVDASASTGSAETTAYENQLAASLTALLSRVVGPDNAAVEVHAVLNFNQQTTTTNGFEVDKHGKPITTPTSQSTTKETYTGSGAGAQASGVLGSSQASTGTNQNGSYTSTQTQTQNAVGQVSQTVQPRTARRRVISYRTTYDSLVVELGRNPRPEEVCTAMGLTDRQATELMSEPNASQLLHLEGRAALQARPDGAFLDVITDEGAEPEAEILASAELEALNEAMETLSEREHTVLFLAFFGGLTQEQIGRIIRVGGPQVCKIHSCALRKLRSVLGPSRTGLEQALAS